MKYFLGLVSVTVTIEMKTVIKTLNPTFSGLKICAVDPGGGS